MLANQNRAVLLSLPDGFCGTEKLDGNKTLYSLDLHACFIQRGFK